MLGTLSKVIAHVPQKFFRQKKPLLALSTPSTAVAVVSVSCHIDIDIPVGRFRNRESSTTAEEMGADGAIVRNTKENREAVKKAEEKWQKEIEEKTGKTSMSLDQFPKAEQFVFEDNYRRFKCGSEAEFGRI